MAGNWWEAGGAAGDQLRGLYAGAGKTGNQIDKGGWDYWSGQQAAGNDITGAFGNSANTVNKLNNLYAGVGKTGGLGGGMVDKEGWDYWANRMGQGEDVTGAFNDSAKQVYGAMDTDAGKASPYAAQNRMGYNVMTRTDNSAFDAVQRLNDAGAQSGGRSRSFSQTYPQAPEGAYQGQGSSASISPAASVSSAGLNNYTQNPYLTQMGQGLQTQFNDNLTRSTLPALRGGAMAAGGVGGSRQGIAEGLAAAGSNTGAANAITSMYGGDYENQMRRNLQQYQGDQQFALGNRGLDINASGQANQYDLGRRGIDLGYQNSGNALELGRGNLALGNKTADQNYNLGIGNLGLGYQNSGNALELGRGNLALGNKTTDNAYNLGLGNLGLENKRADDNFYLTDQGQNQKFFTDHRGLDLESLRTGADLFGAGDAGEWSGIKNASGIYSPYTGYGNTTSGGFDYGRAIGDGMATYQRLRV